MTPQEADKILEMFLHKQCDLDRTKFAYSENEVWCAVAMANSALEKQIPKKPIKQIWVDDEKHKGDVRLATKDDVLTKDNHGSINLCPCCDEELTVVKYLSPPRYDLHCRKCGQALDWSEEE